MITTCLYTYSLIKLRGPGVQRAELFPKSKTSVASIFRRHRIITVTKMKVSYSFSEVRFYRHLGFTLNNETLAFTDDTTPAKETTPEKLRKTS